MNATTAKVAWPQVLTFYGIAAGGAIIVAGLLTLVHSTAGAAAPTLAVIITACLYMPLPLVAGLITERTAGQPTLLSREWATWRRDGLWRTWGRNSLVGVVLTLIIIGGCFLAGWAAGALAVPGAGHLISSDAEFLEKLGSLGIPVAPPLAVLIGLTLVQGLLAGVTINAVFGFGEEYGWRGVLADALAPLGEFRATVLTGVLWGLWHAPIIVLGHNYGTEWGWGIPAMVAMTVPFSFILSWSRRRTGSVLAPSVLHGTFNALLGIFALLVVGGHPAIALPAGLVLSVTLTVVALALPRLRDSPVATVAPLTEAEQSS